MFARELVELAELGLDFAEAVRVELERRLVAAERVGGLAELDLRRVEQFGERREACVERGQVRSVGVRACEEVSEREFLLAIETLAERRAATQEFARVGKAPVLVLEFGKGRRAERVAVEFGDLMAEPFDALAVVDDWLAAANARLLEATPRHWPILRRLLVGAGSAGNLANDVHLAALAIEHGAVLVSFDRDFERFSGLRFELLPG